MAGALACSIRISYDGDGLGVAVGTDLTRARYLEFGTVNVPAYPFLFPALERSRRRIEANIRQAAEAAIAKATDRFRIEPLTSDRLGFPRLTGDPETDAVILWSFYYDRPYSRPPPPEQEEGFLERLWRWLDEHREELKKILERALEALELWHQLRKRRGLRR